MTTRTIRRYFTSLGFFVQKAYKRLVKYKPSSLFISFLTIALAIFLLGGGIYDLLEKPLALLPGLAGRYIFYVPYSLHEQTLNQSIIAMILYSIGVGGFLLTYQSSKYIYKPRQAFTFLFMGVFLTFLAYSICEIIIWWIFNTPLS